MFTRNDYIRYFEELSHVERKMIYVASDTMVQLNDPHVKNSLSRVVADEAKHYSYLLELLADSLDLGATREQRLSRRENSLGQVELKSIGGEGSGLESRGYCVNLSRGGICLESATQFQQGDQYLLRIKLYDNAGAVMERKGRVVWVREILDFHIGGIVFEV